MTIDCDDDCDNDCYDNCYDDCYDDCDDDCDDECDDDCDNDFDDDYDTKMEKSTGRNEGQKLINAFFRRIHLRQSSELVVLHPRSISINFMISSDHEMIPKWPFRCKSVFLIPIRFSITPTRLQMYCFEVF